MPQSHVSSRVFAMSAMMSLMEAASIATWTLQQEIPVPADVIPLLVQGEQAITSFKTFRDSATFTTKRLIVRDAQGISGKKVEIYSLPYSSINMWSSENAGTLDWNSEIELWTRAGHIKVKLAKGADVRRIDSLIAWAVLQAG
ncbi:hypothetical protein SRABI76_03544 [Microbacterium oxydans]|nr:hypothetical protein SRABI76_03544 [Microbacterium oxydans]